LAPGGKPRRRKTGGVGRYNLAAGLLVLETYAAGTQSFIKPGVIDSVEVVATSSQADYQSQFQYALQNSNGVMVFDYAGLLKSGY
jgi:hypothetical protein